MANGNGASGEPLTRDAVQAVRVEGLEDRGVSCEKSGSVHSIAKQETRNAKPNPVGVEGTERTRLVMEISPKKMFKQMQRGAELTAYTSVHEYTSWSRSTGNYSVKDKKLNNEKTADWGRVIGVRPVRPCLRFTGG